MFIIKLQGGLGNQLFQYSFGRLLEIKCGKTVAYDLSFYTSTNKYTARNFLLDKFNVRMRTASSEEISATRYPFGFLSMGLIFCKKIINKFIFKEYQIAYDKILLSSLENKKTAYLEGFWQSHIYYLPIINELQQELTLKENTSKSFENYSQKITGFDSVAIHIRRTDYTNGDKNLQALEKSYYKKAIEYLSTKITSPHYFIFSDDIDWVKKNMSHLFQGATYIEGFDLQDYEELVLISKFKNIIIANSSFSWWGAMLSTSENKIIISPKDWKNIHLKNVTTLCPKEWVLIG